MFDEKAYNKQWAKDNSEKISLQKKQHYLENKEKMNAQMKQWHENNPEYRKQDWIKNKEKRTEQHKEWYKKNKINRVAYNKQWHIDNRKGSDYNKQCYLNNPEYFKQYNYTHRTERNKWERNRRRVDLKFNLNHRMRGSIYNAIRVNKAGKHWEILVGYSLNKLIKHLEKTLPNNYTWQDYLQGKLHIDHIIPIDAFNFTKPEHIDFKRCWDLSNLRLLPAKENMSKGCKLSRPFQPGLQLRLMEV